MIYLHTLIRIHQQAHSLIDKCKYIVIGCVRGHVIMTAYWSMTAFGRHTYFCVPGGEFANDTHL